MTSRKRRNDENTPTFTFVDVTAPKKPRLSAKNAKNLALQGVQINEQHRASIQARHDAEARERAEAVQKEREANEEANRAARLETAMQAMRNAGYLSIHDFILDLFSSRDRVRSSQVTRMLSHHGISLLDQIQARHPQIANDWALSTTRQLIASECELLTQRFQPAKGASVTETLGKFSLQQVLADSERIAPSLFSVLSQVGGSTQRDTMVFKDRNLVSSLFAVALLLY